MRALEGIEIVFFDAGGTLFEVAGSVGAVYARVAARHGVASDPGELETHFQKAFQENPAMAFPGLTELEQERAERDWWATIVRKVFEGKMTPRALESYFEEVYELFRGPDPWNVFPDTRPSLERLRAAGFRLGVISNFDSRLHDVLAALALDSYFERVVVSSRCGAAKPDPAIFHHAVRTAQVKPSSAVHIGDSAREDFEGARRAGLHAILLNRSLDPHQSDFDFRISSLEEACKIIRVP